MLHKIKMFFARIWWQSPRRKKALPYLCLLIVFLLFPGKVTNYNPFILVSSIALIMIFSVFIFVSPAWIKELPEYKEKEADELLDEAKEFLKLEVCEEKYKNELDILITDYNFDKTNLPIKVILRNWIDCYKDIIFLREHVVDLEGKIISMPDEVTSYNNRIDVLITKLDLETQYTEQT